jgi:TP901 family phage tail tape measure protein
MFNDILREQHALQKMTAVQYTRGAGGMISADIIVPRGVNTEIDKMTGSLRHNLQQILVNKKGTEAYKDALDVLRMRVGLFNQFLDSSAHKMINWGKNTQWAGRQLTVGLSVPLAAFAAIAGKAAYDANKQLTRIIKVYDFQSQGAARAAEANEMQNRSMQNGIQVARQYGAALNDTLDVEAQLAATGLQSQELLRSTAQVQRATILGEMDKQDTIKATIALQAILHHSAEQLNEDFNYMNAVENATNLTMQDFVAAIPRALGPLSQLGVSLQDMGVLLAAMKSRGIEAAQGANALKSGLNRVLNPAETVRKSLMNFGIDIDKIVQQSGGNFMQILVELSDQMQGLDNLARQQIIGKLFGTYQFSRVNAIISGLQDVHDTSTQVGRAFEVSTKSAEQWGTVATQEMDRIRNSASGKFKRVVESIKAQFAELGGPFLSAARMVLGAIDGILMGFNKMPHSFKVLAILGAIMAGIAGPLIMLTGLFANLIGQGLNMAHNVLRLGSSFKAMTAQERAAEMLGKQHSYVWRDQASSAQALAGVIQNLTLEFEKLAYAQTMGLNASEVGIGATGMLPAGTRRVGDMLAPDIRSGVDKNGRTFYRKADGTQASAKQIATYKAAADSAKIVANETKATERSWKNISNKVGGVAVAGALGMQMMNDGSSSLLNNLTNAVFIAGMIGPSIVRGLASKSGGLGQKISTFVLSAAGFIGTGITKMLTKVFRGGAAKGALGAAFKGVGAAFTGGKAAGGLAGGLKAALPAAGRLVTTLGRVAGPAGLLATGAFMLMKWHAHNQQLIRDQEQINNSASDWANILGFVYEDYRKIDEVQKGEGDTAVNQAAKKLADTNKPLVERLRLLKQNNEEAKLFDNAIYEGLKAFQHGASPDQAMLAIRVAFKAAGYTDDELDGLIRQVMRQLDFGDDKSVANNLGKQFERVWRDALSGSSSSAGKALEGLGKEFSTAFLNETDPQNKLTLFRNLRDGIQEQEQEFFDSLPDMVQRDMAAAGITSYPELVQAYLNNNINGKDMLQMAAEGLDTGQLSNMIRWEEDLTKTIAEQSGVASDNVHTFEDLTYALRGLGMPLTTVEEGQMQYKAALESARASGAKLTKTEKLRLLNFYRLQAGLKETTNLEDGFGDSVDGSTDKVKKNSAAAAKNAEAISRVADVMKNAYGGAIDAAMSAADTIWSYQSSAASDSLDAQAKAQDKAFDKQERGITHHYNVLRRKARKHYNQQINDLNRQIRREEAAQQRRDAMFEAEQERLQRLADAQNSAIDFNVALATGQLDEAAKIFNNIQATTDQNAIEDAQKKSQTASEKRIANLEHEVKLLERLRDKRLKMLDREEAAEKRALERRKDRFQEEQDAKEEALQNELDLRKMYLDLELAAIRANVPKNKAEYDKQIAQIEAAYGRYGVRLQDYGRTWGEYVGTALDQNVKAAAKGLRDEIDWQFIGYRIANKFAKGAFGLNINQFAKWITTGKLPKGGLSPNKGADTITSGNGVTVRSSGVNSGGPGVGGAHSGGVLGETSPSNLAGRSPSQGLFRDEVLVRAQRGEYMINRQAHNVLGTSFLDSLNAIGRHSGGAIGMSGLSMAMLTGMMSGAVRSQIQSAGDAQKGAGLFGGFGVIPDVGSFKNINDDAMRNAAIILAVGRAMGATRKDLITSIAVSLVESGLHNLNYGDRDSLGLFQQRPSQGWGTPAQIMNPRYSAHAFFASLMRYPQRAEWPIGKAAQIVQRSAYPEIYYGTVPQARQIVSQVLPQLSTGANIKYDNTIANLHKGEKVLTAPLSSSLDRGLNRLESGDFGNTYKVTLDLRGATIDKDVDIEKAVYKAIDKKESKRGRSRRIGDKD